MRIVCFCLLGTMLVALRPETNTVLRSNLSEKTGLPCAKRETLDESLDPHDQCKDRQAGEDENARDDGSNGGCHNDLQRKCCPLTEVETSLAQNLGPTYVVAWNTERTGTSAGICWSFCGECPTNMEMCPGVKMPSEQANIDKCANKKVGELIKNEDCGTITWARCCKKTTKTTRVSYCSPDCNIENCAGPVIRQ